ncbi:MAG: NTP transferase domain-containing protein, partial [Anaerolineae bacterium]|nr:NTP transferase domain-containing protein [Anaerolineae bacterium]
MTTRAPKFSIILAGGKGTRMRSADHHKVCFSIDGHPAINRAIDVYQACGVAHHIVVVGAMAGQVIETIGRAHEGILFAYQAEQLGTAHAARQGARVIEALGGEEEVLIVAGDRVVEPLVLEQFFDLFYSQGCDMAFLVGPRRRRSDPGRVLLYPDGSVLGNVEGQDVWQRQVYRTLCTRIERGETPSNAEVVQLVQAHFDDNKAAIAFAPLWQAIAVEKQTLTARDMLALIPPDRTRFEFVDQTGQPLIMLPQQVEAADLANFSVYLVKTAALRYVLDRLDRNNAQHEEYLSDMITILAQAREAASPKFCVRALRVDNPNYVMAFNDPAELLEIERYVQSKKRQQVVQILSPGPAFRPISEWQKAFQHVLDGQEGQENALLQELVAVYSYDVEMIQGRVSAYLAALAYAADLLGKDERVLLVRSPGRVNVMGRHIDHQGGNCNLMTIGYETLMVVRPRQDDAVRLYNLDRAQFPDRAFSIGDLVADLPWDDWLSLVNSDRVSNMIDDASGDWAQYVKAAALRLQKKFSTVKLRGVDLVVHGNVPIAAGLSSSSSIVVAAAEALVAVNQLDTFPSQFVDLCGEGEWFVGTRGGSADHAAIKLGQRARVVKVSFFEFSVQDSMPFPDG